MGRAPPVFIFVNASPVVALTAPSNGITVTAPATVTLSANASDADGSRGVSPTRFAAKQRGLARILAIDGSPGRGIDCGLVNDRA